MTEPTKTRQPTATTLAARAFRKIAEIKAKRAKADDALARATDKHAETHAKLVNEETAARKALAEYGFTADAVAGDLTTTPTE